MAKKSKCSPNMTYVLCLVIVGLIVYLLYTNYVEKFTVATTIPTLKKQVKVAEVAREAAATAVAAAQKQLDAALNNKKESKSNKNNLQETLDNAAKVGITLLS